jgi:ArsR family transcriptional regulator, arsenate/arsenite/antimonite-responsive transcriptional repressor
MPRTNTDLEPLPPQRLSEAQAADGYAALGNRARLRLLRLLVRAGGDGLNVGEVGRHMRMPASTLAHHLATLVRAGLVIQEKRGREVICTAHYAAIKGAAAYLTEACCAGVDRKEAAEPEAA